MYYVMRASAPSLHRESTDSLIILVVNEIKSVFPANSHILMIMQYHGG